MFSERKQDLSIYYWLKDDVFADTPFINIKDDFPTEALVLPTISVVSKSLRIFPYEIGNYKGLEPRVWYIDIFAQSKSQRDDFGYRILNRIEEDIPVYDYDEGFPPDVAPTQIGCLIPTEIRMEVIRVIPELVTTLYYRATISFEATYSVPR